MSLYRWKGNYFIWDQARTSTVVTSAEGQSNPSAGALNINPLCTRAPHPSLLASSSCLLLSAITALPFPPPSEHHSATSSEITITLGLGNLTNCKTCMLGLETGGGGGGCWNCKVRLGNRTGITFLSQRLKHWMVLWNHRSALRIILF